jgi:hypothetical protein
MPMQMPAITNPKDRRHHLLCSKFLKQRETLINSWHQQHSINIQISNFSSELEPQKLDQNLSNASSESLKSLKEIISASLQ